MDMPSRVAKGLSIALAALLVAAWGGCSRDKKQAAPPAVPVLAADAVQMDVPVKFATIGTVEALQSVAVTPRVTGEILKVAFREGQDVEKGALLFQIDPAPYQAALDLAQANLVRDEAKAVAAESDSARYAKMAADGVVTQEEYEQVGSTGAAARATVVGDRAAVEGARLDLEYCTIRSPIAGRTGNLLIKEGNEVTTGGKDTLVTVNQIAPILVRFAIPEQQLDQVRTYSAAGPLVTEAFPPADSSKVQRGSLTFIDNTVDRATGTVLLKATFPNEDGELWPGQLVQVSLILKTQAGAIVIPSSAVETSQQGDFVYVIRADSTAEQRQVVQGPKMDDQVVITQGIAAGEKVVTDGQVRLVPGARVAIKTGLAPGQVVPATPTSGVAGR